MTFVPGVRLLLSKFDRTRPLDDLLGNDETAFVHLEKQEGVIGIRPIAVPEQADTATRNEFTDAAFDVETKGTLREHASSCSFPSVLLSSFIFCELEYQDGHFSASMIWSQTVLQEGWFLFHSGRNAFPDSADGRLFRAAIRAKIIPTEHERRVDGNARELGSETGPAVKLHHCEQTRRR
jgi:hypothetical protein